MISTRGRYALRVMVDLAEHQQGEHIFPLRILPSARAFQRSIWRVFSSYWCDGLLVGLRGKGGGYRLTRPPELYSGNILRPTEGSLAPVACLEDNAIQQPHLYVPNAAHVERPQHTDQQLFRALPLPIFRGRTAALPAPKGRSFCITGRAVEL